MPIGSFENLFFVEIKNIFWNSMDCDLVDRFDGLAGILY